MNVILFGATGMVGQSALRECLQDDRVQSVLTIGRKKTGVVHPKLRELAVPDLFDLKAIEGEFTTYDVCLFCLGVSAFRMTEQAYTRITYELTMSVAHTLLRVSPPMTFIYVSGMGTDSSERGAQMWARVKGKTENALMQLPFRSAYMFRPGGIIPMDGVRSRTWWYQRLYDVMRPFYPLFMKSKAIVSSKQLGQAMLQVANSGFAKPVLESHEIKVVALKK